MTGAGLEYATSLVEYVCTHHKDLIKKTDSNLYYETLPIKWDAALEIMTGGLYGQRTRAAKELLRLHAKPRPVLIRRKNGNLVSMQPFVLAFDWGKPETLDARAAAKLAHLQKGVEDMAKKREIEAAKKENRPIDLDSIEFPDLLPIEKITIQFSKPLFEDLMIKGGSTYSFPTGMYAKMFHFARFNQQNYNRLKKDHVQDIAKHLNHFENVDERQISAIARFVRYLMRHNNLTAAQMKNKNHKSVLHIPLFDMASEVYPSAITVNGRGERYIDMRKIAVFLDMAIFIYYCIDNFLLYPVIRKGSLTRTTLTVEIYTDVTRAEKELGLNSSIGDIVRTALALPEPPEE